MIIHRPEKALPRKEAIAAALEEMQPPGSGFNTCLCTVAQRLLFAAVGYESAMHLAYSQAETLGVPYSRYWEIERAFNKVYRDGLKHRQGGVRHESNGFTHIRPDVALVEEICRSGPDAAKLRALSPVDGSTLTSWTVLRKLFPMRQTLLCVGEEQWSPRVVMRDGDLHLDRCQFIVPSGMTAPIGHNQSGELSARTLENVGPRRFLVTEMDFSYFDRSGRIPTVWHDVIEHLVREGRTVQDMCSSVLSVLSLCDEALDLGLRLALVVFSGKKSLHGWWYCAHRTDAESKPFFERAITLGADPVTWVPCQWVRMPGGLRYKEDAPSIRQEIFYFDPNYAQSNQGQR